MTAKLQIILGADRCGKSTYIKNNFRHIDHVSLHFDVPNPNQEYWHSDYDRVFRYLDQDLIVCDRGFIEAYHYQDISLEEIKKYYIKLKNHFKVCISLKLMDWGPELQLRHYEELRSKHEYASDWWIDWQIKRRRTAHSKYYRDIFCAFEILDIAHEIIL